MSLITYQTGGTPKIDTKDLTDLMQLSSSLNNRQLKIQVKIRIDKIHQVKLISY